MEFILEVLFELIIEGAIEIGTSRKVNLPLRIFATCVLVLVYGFIVGVIALIGTDMLREGNTLGAIVIIVIASLLAILMVYTFAKKYIAKRKGDSFM